MADAQAYREAASSRGRVVFVLWAQYMADLAAPEAQWIKPEFANGSGCHHNTSQLDQQHPTLDMPFDCDFDSLLELAPVHLSQLKL